MLWEPYWFKCRNLYFFNVILLNYELYCLNTYLNRSVNMFEMILKHQKWTIDSLPISKTATTEVWTHCMKNICFLFFYEISFSMIGIGFYQESYVTSSKPLYIPPSFSCCDLDLWLLNLSSIFLYLSQFKDLSVCCLFLLFEYVYSEFFLNWTVLRLQINKIIT